MLERFGMLDCKPVKIPEAVNSNRDCFTAGYRLTDEDTRLDQSLLGSLMYSMIGTRLDVA
jgi:hypothetical protein